MQTPFFGIGAMRAGTSWLADVLANHPDCGMNPVKEVHFFDVRYNIAGGDFMRYRAKQLEKYVRNAQARLNVTINKLSRKQSSRSNLLRRRENRIRNSVNDEHGFNAVGLPASPTGHKEYESVLSEDVRRRYREISGIAECVTLTQLSAYKNFLLRFSDGCAAFGEITPAYALLPAAAFKEMLSLFPDAKFIFIMRDPIDRLWSQIRYKNGKASNEGRAPIHLNEVFSKALSNPQIIERSNYRSTIETIESEVPADQILYIFYEAMIDVETGPAEIRRIESALGLQPIELSSDLFETTRNASPKSDISDANIAAAMERLAPTYRFVMERFGLPPRWRPPA